MARARTIDNFPLRTSYNSNTPSTFSLFSARIEDFLHKLTQAARIEGKFGQGSPLLQNSHNWK